MLHPLAPQPYTAYAANIADIAQYERKTAWSQYRVLSREERKAAWERAVDAYEERRAVHMSLHLSYLHQFLPIEPLLTLCHDFLYTQETKPLFF